ncbi:phosphohistidine phosphatase SixA [Martelella alba]|uniref:Phosphohistidine phosphatase SixA n=1 Tax=Martelella alba TaxID=2590451 RepID=A0ABY2SG91_9HYPH|nr:phosphohistidine phosphatase SixA [Martelella alba]TKI03859.1 phosphohistidine phosphatase SixA [Martelella alba]
MQVLIMRHGDAALEAACDAERPLTVRGRDESRLMANWLNRNIVDTDRILISPYLRARQTLDVMREVMVLPDSEEVLPELVPGGDASMVCCYLQTLANEGLESILVISHLPLVGYLVADLCPAEQAPMFATSAVACVTVDAGASSLNWQVNPAQLLAKV